MRAKEKDMGDAYRIIVDVDDDEVTGIYDGETTRFYARVPEHVLKATSAANRGVATPVVAGMPYKLFTAGNDSPLGVLAAICAIDPGRSRIIEVPTELRDELDTLTNADKASGITLG